MSLRSQLLLTVGLVILIALGLLAWASSTITRHELKLFLDEERILSEFEQPSISSLMGNLQAIEQVSTSQSNEVWLKVQQLLIEQGKLEPRWLYLVLDRNKDLHANSHPELGKLSLLLEGNRLELREELGRFALKFDNPVLHAIGDWAYLIVLALPSVSESGHHQLLLRRDQELLRNVNSNILLSFAAVGLMALLLTAWMLQKGLQPIAAMQAVINRLRQGDDKILMPVSGSSELTELAHRFNRLLEQHRQNARHQRDELNDLAHELRTPLTAIRCDLEALIDGLKPLGKPSLLALHDEVLHLQSVLQDLQSLALLEAGDIAWQIVALDVVAIIVERVDRMRQLEPAIIWQLELSVDEAWLDADPRRIRQIIDNLLQNAVRYTPEQGSIIVKLNAAEQDGAWLIQVIDQGPGVSMEDSERIFQRFYRVPGQSYTTGSGLGLPIARTLAESMGGRLLLANPGDPGACFELSLPINVNYMP